MITIRRKPSPPLLDVRRVGVLLPSRARPCSWKLAQMWERLILSGGERAEWRLCLAWRAARLRRVVHVAQDLGKASRNRRPDSWLRIIRAQVAAEHRQPAQQVLVAPGGKVGIR